MPLVGRWCWRQWRLCGGRGGNNRGSGSGEGGTEEEDEEESEGEGEGEGVVVVVRRRVGVGGRCRRSHRLIAAKLLRCIGKGQVID
eukprot:scaffold4475_cov114-Isochrysis_galbana.AAC.15